MVSLRSHLAVVIFATLVAGARAAEHDALIDQWLAAQAGIQSWSADLTQTRKLKTLTQPLVTPGRVWFTAPNRFRWELGTPAQTIAVRDAERMIVAYPRLKRAEVYPLDATATGPWRDALALVEAGFPRSRKELDAQFHVLGAMQRDGKLEVRLQPRSSGARRLLGEIALTVDAVKFSLLATEMKFADGSIMRNDFANAVINPTDNAPTGYEIPSDFTVARPGQGTTGGKR